MANKTLAQLNEGVRTLNDSALKTNLTNQAGGAYNHALYWAELGPATGAPMPKRLSDALAAAPYGGSVNGTLAAWTKAAGSVFGSGWAWLTVAKNGSVVVTTSANQENPLTKGDGIPIAGIDVWEHRCGKRRGGGGGGGGGDGSQKHNQPSLPPPFLATTAPTAPSAPTT